MGVTDEIKARLDIVDFVNGYVTLRKAGRNYKGLCPFHSEKTPSFIVFPDHQSWHCFGACSTGGDIFAFLMKKENLDFPEALQVLARRAGVQLVPLTPERKAADESRDRLFEINALAAEYFHALLRTSDAGAAARAYLARRSLTEESIAAFQLGYSLDSWEALQNHLTAKGYSIAEPAQLGLSVQRETGGYYDRFRGRLMFPIRDARGRVVGFGGRALDDSEPKYMNSPDSPIFHKGDVLYGIDRARTAIRAANQAVIVEGYMDVLMAHQHGIANVVASMGTALTEAQLKTLGRLTRRIALALDADAAGSNATLRGLGVAREALERDVVPVPTPIGLIQYESRLQVGLEIVTLPEGKDPDDVIKEGVERWQVLLAGAKPLVDYYFDTVCASVDLETAKGKSEAVKQLAPIIREVGDPVERAHYVQRLARAVHMDDRDLLAIVEAEGRHARRVRRTDAAQDDSTRAQQPTADEWAVLLMCQMPRAAQEAVEILTDNGLALPQPEDMQDPATRTLFFSLWERLTSGLEWADVQSALPDVLAARLEELRGRWAGSPTMPDEQVAEQLVEATLRLRQLRLQQTLVELRFLQDDAAEAHDDESVGQCTRMVAECTQQLDPIQRALGARPWRRRPERQTAYGAGAPPTDLPDGGGLNDG